MHRDPFGYCAEEPLAFSPRTQSAMVCQSGSSWDSNCHPPEWELSALPPAKGESGNIRSLLESGLPGTTSFEKTWKLWRDCSSVQKLLPGFSVSIKLPGSLG